MENLKLTKNHSGKLMVAATTLATVAAMSSASVLADENTPVVSSDPVVVTPAPETDVTPVTPVEGADTPTDGSGTTTPITDVTPVTPVDVTETQPSGDGGATTPTDVTETPIDETPNTNGETETSDPATETPKNEVDESEPSSKPTENGNTPVPNESAVTPPRNVNNDPIINPVETPVELATGQTIVGTEKSQVIVQNVDGTQTKVSGESVGGTVNSDGTVTLTDKEGKKQTLPETGSEVGIFLTIFGTFLMWFGISLTKKRQQLYANLSQFSY